MSRTPHPVAHPRKQIFLLRDLDVSCWSHGSDVPGQIESWEKKTWEKKKNNTFLYPGCGFKYVLEFSPIYLGSPTEDMMSEFTLFTTICHWKCPTLEDDFVSVLFFFCVSLKKIARSCRLLIMSDNMQLQLALFNAQRRFWILFGQIIPRRVQPPVRNVWSL